MQAALDVDWEAVKTLAIAVGVREAARRLGLGESAVMQRSSREGWLRDLPRSQPLPATMRPKSVSMVSTPSEVLRDEMLSLNQKSRLGMARGLARAAAHVETMDGQEVLIDASNIKQTVQSLDVIHGWKESNPVAKVALTITGHAVPSQAGQPVTLEANWRDGSEMLESEGAEDDLTDVMSF